MPSGQNKAFSRVLIDKALGYSGWNLLDPHEVRLELNRETGRADYVLLPRQKEFAQRVTEIREAAPAASRRTKALFQAMLHKAFNGEL
jgi:predicted type IV restriction endonuclease